LFGLLGSYNKNIGFLNLDEQPFLARTMKIDEKFTKNKLIDETINRLFFEKKFFKLSKIVQQFKIG
jgi:hypothetical protein